MHKTIAAYSAIGALLISVLTLIFPAALLILLTGPIGLALTVLLFLVSFVVNFAILFAIGWIVIKIPKNVAIALGIVLLVVGIVLLQPEVDVIALFELFFIFALPKKATAGLPKLR
ncbi:MAG TPA: hypothetical protein VGS11_10805 [Candidatus Bathyarchaeia archaeon]|nr:hypothetical protein [Candidatus Bathyarchaeia archaeon]